MEYTKLGGSAIEVSRLCFGCEPLGGSDWGETDRSQLIGAVRRAVDRGINFFDTADVYGLGTSESVLSEALGEDRHNVVIATKGGIRWQESVHSARARTWIDGSAAYLRSATEASLRRLRLERIPVYQLHRPDPNTPIADTIGALADLRTEGKIGEIGCSHFTPSQLDEAAVVAPVVCAQISFNLLEYERAAGSIESYQQRGVSTLAYGVLAQGLLTGKYAEDARFPESDRRHRLPGFSGDALKRNLRVVARLRETAQSLGQSPASTAIRWTLDMPGIACAIVGAKSAGQVDDNLRAVDWHLPDASRDGLMARVD